jgi:hypothetical protein
LTTGEGALTFVEQITPEADSKKDGPLMLELQDIHSQVSPYRRHIWLIAAPKSGSTWLGAMLLEALKWRRVPMLEWYDRREQEVDLRMLLQHPNEDIFTPHQHTRASQPTINIITMFRIIPVVLVRNIYDSVISLYDHLHKEANIIPWGYFDEPFYTFDKEKQLSAIVDLCVPWFFNFYVSWYKAGKNGLCNLHWATYEELAADPLKCVRDVLDFAGVSRTEEELSDAVGIEQGSETGKTRKNVGIKGRGDSTLNDEQKARIRKYAEYYPDVDFSRLGL